LIVPKFLPDGSRNDVTLVGLNHKMGSHGTTNALLNFGGGTYHPAEEPGAVGYLVGAEHHGLSYMFHMMNEARIGIGCQATATGYAGYLASLEYAKFRTQGRPVGDKDPSRPQVALVEHADVKRMLLAQKSYVEGALALGLYCARLVDEERVSVGDANAGARLLLEVLTPIAKSWPSQWCLEANNLAIQVHGGFGYTKEFDVEQYYRDDRLNAIHEGTHGIHGLDLLGRKVVMQDGAGLTLLHERINRTIEVALPSARIAPYAQALRRATQRLVDVTSALWAPGDVATTLANSSVYLEAAGHVVVAWMWLEQLVATADNRGFFYEGKRAAAQYFYRYELPKVGPQFDLLASLDRTTVDAQADWF
jgi:Acetyl-CoA dehydrogenase C-terminal like/Acyl-CoA dehydrogenase, C-terminal domain